MHSGQFASRVKMFTHSCRPTELHELQLRGISGDPKSTTAELSQMSFRQSFGGGDEHDAYESSASFMTESFSPVGCNGLSLQLE